MNVLGKKIENYKTFSVPIEKEVTKVDKDGNENIVTISYKIKCIDSTKLMTTVLSNFVDNFTGGTHKIKSWFS